MNKNIKIGPVQLTVDADSFSIMDRKTNTSAPGLRSNFAKVINTGKSRIEYTFSAVFANEEEINSKLRPIIAYFRATPFITVKSDIFNKLIASKIVSKAKIQAENAPDKVDLEFIKDKFISDLRNLIIDNLVDPLVKSYINYISKSWEIVDKFIEEELGFAYNNINRSKLRTLGSQYVELNYYISKAEIPVGGGTNAEKMQRLREWIREKMSEETEEENSESESEDIGLFTISSSSDILDGDTFIVNGTTYRLYGADAFETVRPGTQLSPGQEKQPEKDYAQKAKAKLVERMVGKQFRLIEVGSGNYNRKLAIVETVSKGSDSYYDVSKQLISDGYAIPSALSAFGRYATTRAVPYLKEAKKAAQNKVGLWSGNNVQMPDIWRRYAKSKYNFDDPDNPSRLKDNIVPHTLKSVSVLKDLIDSLIESLEGRSPSVGINFMVSAQPLIDSFQDGIIQDQMSKKQEQDSISKFEGFPNDLIPSCFVGISYAAVQDMPEAIQAQFNFSIFNHFPYGPKMSFVSDVVEKNGKATTITDPDISNSRIIQRYVNNQYINEPASNNYLDFYSPRKDVVLHYRDMDRVKLSKGKAKTLEEANIPSIEAHKKSKELLDVTERLVFIDKRITISPDIGEVQIDSLKDNIKKESSVLKLNNFQIESISCNITNNVVYVPIEASAIPTAQHIGRGISAVSIEITSTDENSVGVFRTIEHQIQEAMGVSNQYGTPTSFRIVNPTINMSGIKDFVFDNISISNDTNVPGKYNIRLNLLESINPESEPQEKLVPRFSYDFSNPSEVASRTVNALKDYEGTPFWDSFMETFFPETETDRKNKYPLMLMFAHTHKDTPSPEEFDKYGENKKFIEDFLQNMPEIGSFKFRLRSYLEGLDSILWARHNHPKKHLFMKNNKRLIGPWGPHPGALAGSSDAMADRREHFIAGGLYIDVIRFIKSVLQTDGDYRKFIISRVLFANSRFRILVHEQNIEKYRELFYKKVYFLLENALKSSPNFEGFFGSWISLNVGSFSLDLDDAIIPPAEEPLVYRDLYLPTYKEVFGKTNSVLLEKRRDIRNNLRVSSIYIPVINLDTINDNINSDPNTFKNKVLEQINSAKSSIGDYLDSDSELYNSQLKILKNTNNDLENLHKAETSTTQSGLPVSSEVIPNRKEFGYRSRLNHNARNPEDPVEAGWMYDIEWPDEFDKSSLNAYQVRQSHVNEEPGQNREKSTQYNPDTIDQDSMTLKRDEGKDTGESWKKNIEKSYSENSSYGGPKINPPLFGNSDLSNPRPSAQTSSDDNDKPKKKGSENKNIEVTDNGKNNQVNLKKSIHQQKISKDKFQDQLSNDKIVETRLSSIKKAYPGYAIYFIEEDAEDWGYLDDYYRYDSVLSWDVVQSKTDVDTAVIRFTNFKGVLSNESPNSDHLKDEIKSSDSTIDNSENEPQNPNSMYSGDLSGEEGILTAFKLRPGTRIVIKSGYTTRAEEMEIVFTGQVAEMTPGDIITVICQGYATQLMSSMNKEFGWSHENFPEIISQILYNTTYFGRWELYADRLPGQSKMYSGTASDILKHAVLGDIFPSTADDNIYRISKPHDNHFEAMWDWAWGTGWKIQGPIWPNLYTMTRYVPNSVMTTRPYDARSTLIWADADSYYIDTNHIDKSDYNITSAIVRSASILSDRDISREEIINKTLSNSQIKVNYSNSDDYFSGMDLKEYRKKLYENGLGGLVDKLQYIPTELIMAVINNWTFDKINDVKFFRWAVPDKMEYFLDISFDLPFVLEEKFSLKPVARDRTYYVGRSSKIPILGSSTIPNMSIASISPGINYSFVSTDTALENIKNIKKYTTNDETIANIKDILRNVSSAIQYEKDFDKIIQNNDTIPTNVVDKITTDKDIRLGFLIVYDKKNVQNVFEVTLPASSIVSSAFKSLVRDLFPALYGCVDWSIDNPGTYFSDINKLGEELENSYVPPNMKPIRQTHNAISGINIISNRIKASMSESANSVTVMADEETKTTTLEVSPALKNKIHKTVRDINCQDWYIKTQVAFGVLREELQKMYRGQLLMMGNPRIRPWHEIRIDDYYNNMYGSVEVDKVIHSFNHKSGFTTTVVPHMIVKERSDEGFYAAMYANLKAGGVALVGLGAGLAVGALAFGVGWIAIGIGVIAGAFVGNLTSKISDAYVGMGLGEPAWFLGIPFPSFSGQGLFDESRLNPVKISPLMFRGRPYVVGLEGWSNSQWTFNQYKKHRAQLFQKGYYNFKKEIGQGADVLYEKFSAMQTISKHASEINWWQGE